MLNFHQVHFLHSFSSKEWSKSILFLNKFFSIINIALCVSHRYYGSAQHTQFGRAVSNKFSLCSLGFSTSKQEAAGHNVAGCSSVYLHFNSFVPDFHGCVKPALVAADSINLFSEWQDPKMKDANLRLLHVLQACFSTCLSGAVLFLVTERFVGKYN